MGSMLRADAVGQILPQIYFTTLACDTQLCKWIADPCALSLVQDYDEDDDYGQRVVGVKVILRVEFVSETLLRVTVPGIQGITFSG